VAKTERRPDDQVGGYRIVRLLGRGGSGAVYLVTDEGGGEAALKLVDTSDAGARVRLAREVAALQALRHAAVPRVLDAELDDEDAFVVFEFIDGPSLSQHVRARGPLPSGQVAELASALAGALAAVHAAGVVHRDVTPANVLLGRTGPVLIDFGISHQFEDDRLTRTGLVSGTAGYVAPEVIDGGEPTAASDDWGLAATLAFAATGHAPFGTGMGALSATLAGDVRPDVPLALARALTAAPQFRPRPEELARMLAEADQTSVLDATEVEPTLVAAAWDDAADQTEAFEDWADDDELSADDELPEGDELPERVIPKRRAVLLAWGVALVALATVAPLIAAALMLAAAVVARGVESAARAVWRSRQRRGVEQGGIVAQAFASPWHLGRALVLTLPSAALAALAAFGLFYAGHSLTRGLESDALSVGVSLALPAAAAVLLLGWGPRGREARTGAHLVAAGVAPDRFWSIAWAAAGVVIAIAMFGISFAGIDQVWWPIRQNGPN
jgi:predicted Ser/Thr protein kinase